MENIIEKKKIELARKKQMLANHERLLQQQLRKERTRRLIERGGLITKAGLEFLDDMALLGALIDIKQKANDDKQIAQWSKLASSELTKDQKQKTPVVVTFDEKPNLEIRQAIRDAGLKWNALRQEWEGRVDLENLKTILENQKAKITVLDQKVAA